MRASLSHTSSRIPHSLSIVAMAWDDPFLCRNARNLVPVSKTFAGEPTSLQPSMNFEHSEDQLQGCVILLVDDHKDTLDAMRLYQEFRRRGF